jgi:hypothetical protein
MAVCDIAGRSHKWLLTPWQQANAPGTGKGVLMAPNNNAVEPTQLVLTPRQVFWKSCGIMAVLALVLIPVLVAPVAALLSTAHGAAGRAVGAAVLIIVIGLDITMWVMISIRYRGVTRYPLVVEATAAELHFTEGSAPMQTISRTHLVSVVRLSSPDVSGNRLQFRDSKNHQIGVWDTSWPAASIMDWLNGLGYETSWLRGRAAIAAAEGAVISHTLPRHSTES